MWPLTLWALHLDNERRLFWHVAPNEVAVLAPHQGGRHESLAFLRPSDVTTYEKAVLLQELRRAKSGPTLEQRLAVDSARTRAQSVLPRSIVAKATEVAFSEARSAACKKSDDGTGGPC